MRVVNMAHGALYLLGGYLALEMQDSWFKEDTGLGLSLSGTGDATYRPGQLGRAADPRDADHRPPRRDHAAGLPALEPGPGPAPGADHDRPLGDLRRPDAGRVRRHLEGHQDAHRLAREHRAAGRRALRLLPRRGRAGRRAPDRPRAVVADQPHPLRARSCVPASTTATWSRRSGSTCSSYSRPRSSSAPCWPGSAACSAAR